MWRSNPGYPQPNLRLAAAFVRNNGGRSRSAGMARQLQSNCATIVWLLQIDVIVSVFHSDDGSCARRFYVYMRAIR